MSKGVSSIQQRPPQHAHGKCSSRKRPTHAHTATTRSSPCDRLVGTTIASSSTIAPSSMLRIATPPSASTAAAAASAHLAARDRCVNASAALARSACSASRRDTCDCVFVCVWGLGTQSACRRGAGANRRRGVGANQETQPHVLATGGRSKPPRPPSQGPAAPPRLTSASSAASSVASERTCGSHSWIAAWGEFKHRGAQL